MVHFRRGTIPKFSLVLLWDGSGTSPEYEAFVDETALLVGADSSKGAAVLLHRARDAFDLLTNVEFNWAEGADEVYPRGAEGSINMLTGLGLVYDTRHNVLNVRHGLFSELAFLHSNVAWGSDYQFSTSFSRIPARTFR